MEASGDGVCDTAGEDAVLDAAELLLDAVDFVPADDPQPPRATARATMAASETGRAEGRAGIDEQGW
jgi:hypothetical protein